jgi:hypothetical protein
MITALLLPEKKSLRMMEPNLPIDFEHYAIRIAAISALYP